MACHSAEQGVVGIGFASMLEIVAHRANSTEVGFKKKAYKSEICSVFSSALTSPYDKYVCKTKFVHNYFSS